MPSLRFANVLLENNPRSINCPDLYCHSDKSLFFDPDVQEWCMIDAGTYDFSTFFNALSVMKLRRYAGITNARLHLQLKGSSCTIIQTRADVFSDKPETMDHTAVPVAGDEHAWQDTVVELSLDDTMVLAGFKINTEGKLYIRNGYYEVDVPHDLNAVELALATTTFKKESYILNNVQQVKDHILGSQDEEIAKHFHMYVVDNGKTLDAPTVSTDGVTVIPNENVGGSGGFARGMIAAMEQNPQATHVILMDDDVSLSIESIKRTYNLLRMVKQEYRDHMVSGAMMNYNNTQQQWEDTGYVTAQGRFAPCKDALRLTRFSNLVYNEMFVPEPKMQERNHYAGWWYCCIPVDVIKKNGLPLPLFVRGDDAEYGIRCNTGYITMNSICVWHEPFNEKYDAAVERYQVPRNDMIISNMSDVAPHSDFFHELHHMVELELKKFGYTNADLVLDAFEDFLKGPDFFSRKGQAQKSFMDAHKKKEQLVDFATLQGQIDKDPDIQGFSLTSIDPYKITQEGDRSFPERIEDFLTDNRQRYLTNSGSGYAVIPTMGWMYPARAIRGKKKLIVIDWYTKRGTIREKDPAQYRRIVKRYKRDLKYYKAHADALRKQYKEAFPRLTSMEFWKQYLDMQ